MLVCNAEGSRFAVWYLGSLTDVIDVEQTKPNVSLRSPKGPGLGPGRSHTPRSVEGVVMREMLMITVSQFLLFQRTILSAVNQLCRQSRAPVHRRLFNRSFHRQALGPTLKTVDSHS